MIFFISAILNSLLIIKCFQTLAQKFFVKLFIYGQKLKHAKLCEILWGFAPTPQSQMTHIQISSIFSFMRMTWPKIIVAMNFIFLVFYSEAFFNG